MQKPDFIGKEALKQRLTDAPRKKLVTLKINTDKAAAHSGASLMDGDKVVGTVTSGDWGYRTGLNLAYAFVDTGFANIASTMQLDLCGDMVLAEVIPPSPYDPKHERMRG
jgi:dimethylglycine dehydrogenase